MLPSLEVNDEEEEQEVGEKDKEDDTVMWSRGNFDDEQREAEYERHTRLYQPFTAPSLSAFTLSSSSFQTSSSLTFDDIHAFALVVKLELANAGDDVPSVSPSSSSSSLSSSSSVRVDESVTKVDDVFVSMSEGEHDEVTERDMRQLIQTRRHQSAKLERTMYRNSRKQTMLQQQLHMQHVAKQEKEKADLEVRQFLDRQAAAAPPPSLS